MSVLEFFSQLHQRTEAALAEASFSAFGDLLKSLHLQEATDLAEIHCAHGEAVVRFLADHRGLGSSIKFVYERVINTVTCFDDMLDPTIMGDMASLVTLCLEEYPSAFQDEAARSKVTALLESILSSTVERLASRVSPQINVLARVIVDVIQFLSSLHVKNARIILLELPVGNSIPTQLLLQVLQQRGYKVEILRVSLSRNDKAKRGVTRDALLETALEQAAVGKDDLVIYMDEWCSGTNFNRISKIVARKMPAGSFFLPVALLTEDSGKDKRYDSQFCPDHDQLVRQLGASGSRFRHVFPRLQSRLVRFGDFFWSEHDRTAGYRKMQFLGSIFSTLDAAIEEMHTTPDALRIAKYAYLKLASDHCKGDAEVERVAKSLVKHHEGFAELFNEWYEDYKQCRPAIEAIDHLRAYPNNSIRR